MYAMNFYNLIYSLISMCLMNISTQTIIAKSINQKERDIIKACLYGLMVLTAAASLRLMLSIFFQFKEYGSTQTFVPNLIFTIRSLCLYYLPFVLLLISRKIEKIALCVPVYVEVISVITAISIIKTNVEELLMWSIAALVLSTALTIRALISTKKILLNWHFDFIKSISILRFIKSFVVGFIIGTSIASWIASAFGANNATVIIICGISSVVCSVLFYLIPTIIAVKKKHLQKVPIILVNIFLGWSLIGWIVALVWACMQSKPKIVHIHNESKNMDLGEKLRSLEELRKSGLITDEEYEGKKSELLKNY